MGHSSTQRRVAKGSCDLKARIYHAHARCTYGRLTEKREQALIRHVFPEYEIVDPGLYEENEEKRVGRMDYCLKLVDSCNALAFSRILDKVTSGVGLEVEHALASGKPVYELIGDGVRRVSEPPAYVSIDETLQLYDEWEHENFDEWEAEIQ